MLFARSTDQYRVESPLRSAERAVPLRAAQRRHASFMGALLAFCVFTAMPALAGLGGSVVPSFPTPIHVGDLKTASIRITNSATGTNAAENVIASRIFITPSCAAVANTGVSCATPDLGVFQFSTVFGSVGSSCENMIFTIGQPNGATGEFELIPHVGQTVVLGPANGSGPLPTYCEISINFKVLRLPVDSTPADVAMTTDNLARATLRGATTGFSGSAFGGGRVLVDSPLALAAAPGNSQVALNWSGGTVPASYKLYYSRTAIPASCSGTMLMNGTSTSFMQSGLTNGSTYYYRLCTIDATGAATAGPTATAVPANAPPVANAGSDQSGQTLTALSFNGSASFDPDGTITSYAWTFGDGNSASGVSVSHSYAVGGTYVVTLTVTDNQGSTASASVTVTIANRPPIANAGPNQTAQAGIPVSLNGSGSSDPDGTITNYSWSFGDGGSATGVGASHVYNAAGIYTATLTVTDNLGATGSASATITVTGGGGPGAYRWSRQFGGPGSAAVGNSTAVDAAGNILVAGVFTGTVNLGGSALVSAGGMDIFVAKYSPSGAHIWSKRFGGSGDDIAQSVAVDAAGNVILGGTFMASVSFGGSPLTSSPDQFGSPSPDAFIAKFGPDGTYQWSKGFGGVGNDVIYAVAADSGGNVVAAGTFVGSVNFGGTTLSSRSSSADMFLAKYSPTGALTWVSKFGDYGTDVAYGLAIDGGDNIFMAGTFEGTVNFGGGALTALNFSADIALAKFSPAGVHMWSKRFGGNGQDIGYSVATNASGNVALTGYFQGSVDFGGGTILSKGDPDSFLAVFSPTGTHLWSYGLGSANPDEGLHAAMDSAGNVVVAGTFQGTENLGTGPLVSAGSWDLYVAKYSPSGAPLWSRRFGGAGDEIAYAVSVDTGGNIVASGYFRSTTDFGGGPVSPIGYTDLFILNLAP